MTASPDSVKPSKSHRWLWWLVALILVFVLGFLLGRMMLPKCPRCPAPPAAGAGGSGGSGGGGGGKPQLGTPGAGGSGSGGGGGGASGTGRVLGDGGRQQGSGGGGGGGGGAGSGEVDGNGHGNASGTTVGHGYDGSAHGENGTVDGGGGGGSGKSKLGLGTPAADANPDATQTAAGVWRLAAGGPLSANGIDPSAPSGKEASVKVLTAPDFRYDKTNLPRYPDSVTAVSSAISYPSDGRTDSYQTSAGIVTSSSFDTVVDWYRKHLPPGWQDMTIGDFSALAKQLSTNNIMNVIASAGNSAPQPATAAATGATAEKVSIAMFRPPTGTNSNAGVMIVKKGDHPVETFLKAKIP
jgi:hypothetical protein